MCFEKDYQILYLGYCNILNKITKGFDEPQINIIEPINKEVVEINELQDQLVLDEIAKEDVSNLELDLPLEIQPSDPEDLYNLETYTQQGEELELIYKLF